MQILQIPILHMISQGFVITIRHVQYQRSNYQTLLVRFLLRLFLTIAVLSIDIPLSAKQNLQGIPQIDSYDFQKYKGGILNLSVTQDSNGVLYVANNFGMLSFNGSHWKLHKVPGNRKVRSVAATRDGKILVGSKGDFGYFKKDEFGILNYTSLVEKNQVPEFNECWKVFETPNGHYGFYLFDKLYIEQNGILKLANVPYSVAMHCSDQIYFQTKDGSVHIYNETSQASTIIAGLHFESPLIAAFPFTASSRLFISSNNIKLQKGGKIQELSTSLNQEFRNKQIQSAMKLTADNSFAIGTQSNGYYHFDHDGNMLEHLTIGKGIDSRQVRSIYQDIQGDIWLGMTNSISKLRYSSPFRLINEESGLRGTGYAAVHKNNATYLGTDTGLYNFSKDSIQLIQGSLGQVYTITETNDEIWVGHHKGLFKLKDDKLTLSSNISGVWDIDLFHNQLILSAYSGIYQYYQNDTKYSIKKISSNRTNHLTPYRNKLWFSNESKGIASIEYKEGQFAESQFLGPDQGVESPFKTGVFHFNGYPVFSIDQQIKVLDQNQDQLIESKELETLIATDHLSFLKQDVNGNIYFIENDRLGLLIKKSFGNYERIDHAFEDINPFLNDDIPGIHVLSNGEVYINAKEGFLVLDPKQINKHDESNFKIQASAITISDGSAKQHLSIKANSTAINHRFNNVKFELAVPNKINENIQFSHKLNGDEWSDWYLGSDIELANLYSGSYEIQVRAKANKGLISETWSYDFKIEAPWYRQSISYIAYAIFFLGTVAIALYFWDKRHRKEKEAIQAEKEKQIAAKNDQLAQVAEDSKMQIERLKNEQLNSQIQYKNRELATSTMHILNKNQFISGIKKDITGLNKVIEQPEIKNELSKIVRQIDKNISGDKEWKQFEQHFNQVHGDFYRKLKIDYPTLSPQELKLCSYLRMNMNTKEIANLLNISVRGVEISRYRLRKKLQLERKTNLVEFIISY